MNTTNAPLQPLGNEQPVPRGLDAGAPGHTPIPQSTGPPRDLPAHTDAHPTTAGDVVLTVTAPENKTVHVTGGAGAGYTMLTAFDGHREVVTISHGAPADPTQLPAAATHGHTEHVHTGEEHTQTHAHAGEAPLARLEQHQLLADKLSLNGGPALKLKQWLAGTATCVSFLTLLHRR